MEMKMHSTKECKVKCTALLEVLNTLRVTCLLEQDYDKLNQVESALQLITELSGEMPDD